MRPEPADGCFHVMNLGREQRGPSEAVVDTDRDVFLAGEEAVVDGSFAEYDPGAPMQVNDGRDRVLCPFFRAEEVEFQAVLAEGNVFLQFKVCRWETGRVHGRSIVPGSAQGEAESVRTPTHRT